MNQQPAHTPGPWHRNIKPASTYCTVWSGRNTHVAYVTGQGKLDEKEIEANIQLIAAAPELLQVCKAILKEFRQTPNPSFVQARYMDMLKMAINNAERKEQ